MRFASTAASRWLSWGARLRSTPADRPPAGVRGLQFRDEAASVNALVPELRAKGVGRSIVVLIHEGGRSSTPVGEPGCADFEGPIIGIVKRLDRAVDVVVSGHTHEAYVCEVDGRTVTSAASYGRVVTTDRRDARSRNPARRPLARPTM